MSLQERKILKQESNSKELNKIIEDFRKSNPSDFNYLNLDDIINLRKIFNGDRRIRDRIEKYVSFDKKSKWIYSIGNTLYVISPFAKTDLFAWQVKNFDKMLLSENINQSDFILRLKKKY